MQSPFISCIRSAVVIGLESDYTINEGETQEVCAVLREGTLERDAIVTLTTVAGTASGKSIII